jgi:GMP synthase (glutamine-hydrolysing)
MKKLLIIKAGTSHPELIEHYGDFDDWIINLLPVNRSDCIIVNAVEEEALPGHETVSGVIVSGSHNDVTEGLPWMIRTSLWLRTALERQMPAFGICFGHQLLAHAAGGTIGFNPNGREAGVVAIKMNERAAGDLLFGDLPQSFQAIVHHKQTVINLPHGAQVLAQSNLDAVQVLRYHKTAWSVQFHPEFNSEIITAYLKHDGENSSQISRSRHDLSFSAGLVANFFSLIP